MVIIEFIGFKILIEVLGYCLKSMLKSSMLIVVDLFFVVLKLI